ncbi:AAA domain-containing protein [Candidatus Woesearchaeota archaeon]|nr:AAA domain-containing protein [Candidatus Woesearchaeota archaeon]
MKNIKKRLLDRKDIFTDIIGQEEVKKNIKSGLISGRNLLIVGAPGIGKTTLARNIANVLTEGKFVRIQGSPDLTVEDLLGDIDPIKAMKYGASSIEAFTKGKIFKADKGVLFFDELNRCPEKLQNALLQVLEEKKATIGGYDVDFDVDFIFIGTMNPEDSSTEKLSDVLLDRFDVVYMGYPGTSESEKDIVTIKDKGLAKVEEEFLDLMIDLVREIRDDDDVEKKPSVRASIGLYERSQSNALVNGRSSVDFSDIKNSVVSVLAHRIRLKPNVKYLKSPEGFVKEKFEKLAENKYSGLKAKGGGP